MDKDIEEQTISGHTIRIDRTLCIGSGNCVAVAPEVFVLGTDQIVTFVEAPEEIDADRLVEACAVCPVDALIAIGPDGDEIVPRLILRKDPSVVKKKDRNGC